MKLQNLIIIFIIIIIPIILIFSLYLNLETQTIIIQTDYDEKLIEATKEAMEAFEINTIEWNSDYSTLANSKRQDLMASISVFTTSLAGKLRIDGTRREDILSYVPAIVYTMYDGYYIYSPTYIPQTITDDKGKQLFYYRDSGSEGSKVTASATQNIEGTIHEGEAIYELKEGKTATGTYNGKSFTTDRANAKSTYKHVLKTFVPYTTNYKHNGKMYTINYTLDNYVRIYGAEEDVANIAREGYVIDNFYHSSTGYRITVPVNSISGIKFDGKEIKPEILTENVPVRDSMDDVAVTKTYAYIYNSNNDKRYYDSDTNKFFTINKNYIKEYLPDTTKETTLAEFKKVSICPNTTNWEYTELYQLINGTDNDWYYIDSNNQYIKYTSYQPAISKQQDCSAINYFVENYDFNCWLVDESFDIKTILAQKNEKIIENININLNLSMSNYSANSRIDYKLPELTDKDWEQALSNISMITFWQGKKIGLKTYNNYVVVSSTQNNEYVGEDSLYYMDSQDEYYHRYGCSSVQLNTGLDGAYRSTEFKPKSYNYKITGEEDYAGIYYKHAKIDAGGQNSAIQECFDCIVNRNNLVKDTTNYEQVFYTAIARERYVQMQRTRLTSTNAIVIETPIPETPTPEEPKYDALSVAHTIIRNGNDRTIALAITGGSGNRTITWYYKTTATGIFQADVSASNQIAYVKDRTYYIQYTVRDLVTEEIITRSIDSEIVASTEFNVTYTQQTINNRTKVTFTLSGGIAPYSYQIRSIDGLWGQQVTITGNILTTQLPSGDTYNTYTYRFSDSAGNTKLISLGSIS